MILVKGRVEFFITASGNVRVNDVHNSRGLDAQFIVQVVAILIVILVLYVPKQLLFIKFIHVYRVF